MATMTERMHLLVSRDHKRMAKKLIRRLRLKSEAELVRQLIEEKDASLTKPPAGWSRSDTPSQPTS